MKEIYLAITVLFPMVFALPIPFVYKKSRKSMCIYTEIIVLITSLLAWLLMVYTPTGSWTLIKFTGDLSVSFHMDGLGKVFVGLVSVLWPFATLYSFEYMKHEEHENIFFLFYTMTFGVTVGIAISANILSMYFFYELLTLVTTPLVVHTLKREAVLAGRTYLYYSLGGAAFAFIGMIFILVYGFTPDFTYGGVLDPGLIGDKTNILLLVYVLAFMGFGVKAAIFPLCTWLPKAGVAPTPVTALLHAVAVVKSGAFAIMRLTYYCYGTDYVRGTWAQYVVMGFAIFTIVYGCSMAVRDRHMKRRLAYSTVSNLSYILFGVTLMTPMGLVGALMHMITHAFMKICAFFCAGAIMYKTGRQYVYELDGLGKKMPITFGVFTVSALALMGVPGLCGFVSKYTLASAAVESGTKLAYVGVGALLISAILTAIYMLSVSVRAFFPKEGFSNPGIETAKDPNWMMLVPLCFFVVGMVVFGLWPTPFISFFTQIAEGLM